MPDLINDELLNIRRIKLAVGMNDVDEPDAIGDEQVELLQNVVVSRTGRIDTRGGITLVADDQGALRIDGLGHFTKEGSTPEQHMVTGGTWYRRDAGASTWTSVKSGLSSGATTFFLQAGNLLLMSNGIDNVHTWNGTVATDEGNTNVDPPKFHFAIYHNNRVFAGRTDESLVYYSDTLDAQTWDRAVNAIKPDHQDSGTGRALIKLSISDEPGFVFFKDNSSFFVNTTDATPGNWTISVIDSTHGTVGPRSAVYIGSSTLVGGVAYLSDEGSDDGDNRYRLRSILRTANDAISPGPVLSRDLEGDTFSDLNEANDDRVATFLFDNKIFVAFPSGASSCNDKVAVLDLNVSDFRTSTYKWQKYDGWCPAVFDTFEESDVKSLYFGNDSTDSVVYKAFSGATDAGTAIEAKFIGRSEDGGLPELNKTWEAVEVFFKGTDESTATIKAIFDDGAEITLGTVTLQTSGPTLPVALPFNLSASDRILAKFPLDTQVSRTVQIVVEHSSGAAGNTMNFLGYVLYGWVENISFGETK